METVGGGGKGRQQSELTHQRPSSAVSNAGSAVSASAASPQLPDPLQLQLLRCSGLSTANKAALAYNPSEPSLLAFPQASACSSARP